MAIFVYITEDCRKDARTHALSDEIDRLKERIESSQSLSHFNPFPPPYLVKKKLGGRQGRLVADLRKHGDHAVVVFLAIMIRGDKAYEHQFSVDPVAYGNQHFENLVSPEELADYVEERTQVEPPPAKPEPNETEYGFLYEAFSHRQVEAEDDMVYETAEWKDAVSEPRVAQQLVRFAGPCLAALSADPGVHLLDIPGKPGWGIWTHRSEGRLLLIAPVTDENGDAASRVVERYREQIGAGSLQQILRASRRAYPAYMLADEDTWVEIEKEPVANMALSPEESEVLLSVRDSGGAFPLFVNGRAGSGKSTILQYLFADLLYYYLSTPNAKTGMAPPVYLTANGELLRVARSFVERILRNESAFRTRGGNSALIEGNAEIIGEAFREFQPYLLSMVDPATRRERFQPANRVGYSEFRRLWNEWFGMDREAVRDFGPDLSWHVIRSYIKGVNSESFLDPDDYAQLPENQITVEKDTFRKVYERVWEGRYAQIAEAQGLWDDQDLTRFILEIGLVRSLHPALVCDEAQDFTRIELELLLRLNLFSNRSVPPHDLSRVPFAFAGDQFQTLNPTGFRWESIKASFVEKFIQALDPAGRSGRADLNYRELRYNYRSTAPIVRFSNGIQALRSALFDMPEIRPQTPWTLAKRAFPVVWFRSNDGAFWGRFKEADTFVVIVPCNEGEEAEFVRNDPFLSQHIRLEEGIPQNVLSAARAKGREYPVVVVYGFGNACPPNLMQALDRQPDGLGGTKDRQLPNQYFINRLYVAASRPKQRLIIVDDEDGLDALWSFAQNEETARRVHDAANRGRCIWTVDPDNAADAVIEGMAMGTPDALSREDAGDPVENAKAFEEDGKARKDAFLLRQAALAYRSAGDVPKATECRAWALEIEGNFLEAGNAFVDCNLLIPSAVRSYWRAGRPGCDALVELGKQHAVVSRETEFKWARALPQKELAPAVVLDLLEEVAARMHDQDFGSFVLQEKAWKEAIIALIKFASSGYGGTSAKEISSVLERIEGEGLALPHAEMAEILFRACDLDKAVERWDKAGETKSENYLKAKATIEPYPGKLAALARTKSYEEILREFQEHREIALGPEQWGFVSEAYLSCGQWSGAIDSSWEAGSASLLRRCALRSLESGQTDFARQALVLAVFAMVGCAEWEALATFASSLEFAPDPDWSKDGPRELVEGSVEALQAALVRGLSRSEKFVETPGHLQRQFSDFLRRFLRAKEGRWRGNLTVEEAGAAFERGGRFTDAISFYEAVAKEANFSDEEKHFARERWLVAKKRQLDYEREQGTKGKKISDLERDLEIARSKLGVRRVADLAKFPILDPITRDMTNAGLGASAAATKFADTPNEETELDVLEGTTESISAPGAGLAERVESKISDFVIVHSRKLGRVNITDERSMKTSYVNLRESRSGGEVPAVLNSTGEWSFADWGILVKFTAENGYLAVEFASIGVRLVIEHPLFGAE